MSEPKRSDDPRVPADAPLDEGPRQRARTMSRKEMARQFRRQKAEGGRDPEGPALIAELEATRPRKREDCVTGPRPCAYVSCKYNLSVDVNPKTGSAKEELAHKEPSV